MIRNFCVIAHIDSGKTTLTDRFLELTGTVSPRQFHDRFLDAHPIEQERGVTIKLAPATLHFEFCTLNLIDTPGHVDFSYEVKRSLAACEGAILLIDGTRGIQAQTLSHAHQAINLGLTLIPAINKIDLPSADVNQCLTQLNQIFGFRRQEVSLVSAKTGAGVPQLLQRVIQEIPPPSGQPHAPLRALVFNSIYHHHLGVIAFVRLVDGQISPTDTLTLVQTNQSFKPQEIGIFTPSRQPTLSLSNGQVGYLATGLKDIRPVHIGDTITTQPTTIVPLPGYKPPPPLVFVDAYPASGFTYHQLLAAINKLRLSDSSLSAQPIHSPALGAGINLGFLGLFHIDITKDRLQREHQLEPIFTPPTVAYQFLDDGRILEPMVAATIVTPSAYVGSLMQLFQNHRGLYQTTHYFGNLAQLIYHLPLSELLSGLIDQLKSLSSGYASLDYQPISPQPVNAVKLDILLHHQPIAALSRIVVRDKAYPSGQELVAKIKQILPPQQFPVAIQAAIGSHIIARATKPALRKDVTAKLYGGDQTRKDKLLTKQKQGKKILAQSGKITLPPDLLTRLATQI